VVWQVVQGGNAFNFSATLADVDNKFVRGGISRDGDLDGRIIWPIGKRLPPFHSCVEDIYTLCTWITLGSSASSS
jgi:hypothetical protein